ncbi:hypothetical protein FHX48_000697 [Microbacterium halimionae]|uniref:Uncharacterized protein n=1 Tax=Microbacterium halimionae TaxID=1526413 RepID=A0A7W3JMP7_9MICO|nr:hypothetical protein [Microbacterium halimionae]MBA8815645.1 hypothetical protein [Microbacterium halimionae]NII95692.1 hypothetical protein [Microbacterium halimionae]
MRQVQALKLRAAGCTYQTIADRLGYASKRGAWSAVNRALDQQRRELAREFLELELQRLDEMSVSVYRRAVNGDVKAIDSVLKIMDRRAKLLNLYRANPSGAEREGVSLLQSIEVQLRNSPDTYVPVEELEARRAL